MTPRFLRARYFFWIIVPLAAWLIYFNYGAPHFIWSYEWRDNGTHDPFAKRHYTRCTYLGPFGSFTEIPRHGRCAWIRFYQGSMGNG